METIDRPFRFTRAFCLIWALLSLPAFMLTGSAKLGPWYSDLGITIVVSLIATFILYGPVLLVRQMVRSGSRGRFIARVFLPAFLAGVLLIGGLSFWGFYPESTARVLALSLVVAATGYLSWSVKRDYCRRSDHVS